MNTIIVPITDFVRKLGEYTALLPRVNEIILTREGRPFATVKATPEEKNKQLLKSFGAWKGTNLDSDEFWEKVLVRKSRKKQIKIW